MKPPYIAPPLKFEIGDTVILKSNDRYPMTVVEITYLDKVVCKWISKTGIAQQQEFPPNALEKA